MHSESFASNFHNWSVLNDPKHPIRNQITRQWNELLQRENIREEVVHSFIAENVGFFFIDGFDRLFAISKLRLNTELIPDLLVAVNCYSYGNQFVVIELKRPNDKPFNADGSPSKALNRALTQTRAYRTWVRRNTRTSKELLATNLGSDTDMAPFKYAIVIGRRHMYKDHRQRAIELQEDGIEIMSYDRLTDYLMGKEFRNLASVGGAQGDSLSLELRSKLANPFMSAFSDEKWRKLLKEDKYRHHFVAHNGDNIVAMAEYSKYYDLFLESERKD